GTRKSTMYLPITTCRLKRTPRRAPRTASKQRASVEVGSERIWRARSASQSLGGIQRDMMGLSVRTKDGICPSQRSHCDSTDIAPATPFKRAGVVGARPGTVRLWGGQMHRLRGAPLLCPVAHILLNNDNVHAVISQKKSHILPIDNISH